MEQIDAHTLVKNFLSLQNDYQFTRRSMITKERFKDIANADKTRGLDIEDESLKEPLIEHVGHLPIIATYFYEHIEHKEKIDLGRALIMLSIHDIGETKVGDIFSYIKSKEDKSAEMYEAKKLLSPTLHRYIDEYELGDTFDAKYAKSIDVLAPLLHSVDLIGYVHTRFLKYGGTNEKIITKKRHLLEWDSALLEVFDLCLEQSTRYEKERSFYFRPLSMTWIERRRVQSGLLCHMWSRCFECVAVYKTEPQVSSDAC